MNRKNTPIIEGKTDPLRTILNAFVFGGFIISIGIVFLIRSITTYPNEKSEIIGGTFILLFGLIIFLSNYNANNGYKIFKDHIIFVTPFRNRKSIFLFEEIDSINIYSGGKNDSIKLEYKSGKEKSFKVTNSFQNGISTFQRVRDLSDEIDVKIF